MRKPFLLLTVMVIIVNIMECIAVPPSSTNNKPIIGILAQPTLTGKISKYGKYYIDAAYVKFVESGGARAVPIRYDLPVDELRNYFNQVNGMLFPGGCIDLVTQPGSKHFTQYTQTQKLFMEWSMESFDTLNDYFPIYGTCLGFQAMALILSNDTNIMQGGFDSENMTLPLDFTLSKGELVQTRLFHNQWELIEQLTTRNVTFNAHRDAIPYNLWMGNHLLQNVQLIATNLDRKGQRYASLFEHKKFPFYASQFHPEKPLFEWNPHEVINHSAESIVVNSYFGRFFVDECRRNFHKFNSPQSEEKALIYNYVPIYTYELVNDFEQCYFV